ncbi:MULTISPECIES: superoxide dismutase[Cu-Zn] [Mycobacterium]|uniref:Superoxide dismutase [Cu-Zn] n=1 Tax=Mycobacterium kiyosense TaxID=2871094 RepID=A0A9P3Q5U2_9MYCO|nr:MULTISPECIES: superoxide dismutase family protein [Mycobacterium]BDB40305.1 superoxide dismutase [Cu-Zn] [Mycobacterium kiyosense]BDE12127.1 superoxide dismutase [Cu-Zn] [Mycobacterium sp. 20KCMC460]GLB83848.1 superoxide dismutase [Cu-Zn] [Mycobacterium kiyosense]GLB88718.1 superoxide dismutase [Cu-Zn] [Mycobacterium kiyosense]GLB95012.1 superoxide dismutase [Cu-Zn] [Mycobacterium kiyosense]
MPKPAAPKVAAVTAALSAAASVALLSACSSPQQASTTPGTNPTVWTGSPGPSTSGHAEAAPSTQEAPPAGQTLTTVLKGPGGNEVATAKFEFANGYATVTVTANSGSGLAPGFHGMHIHKVGKCEPNSVAPNGGPTGDFLSAGGHFQAPGSSGHSSGDLTSLQVRKNGAAMLVTTTDGFTMDDLISGAKTAIIIHEGPDNFMNIPDRYQVNGVPGPDETTMTTGDAGKRVACGVIGSG